MTETLTDIEVSAYRMADRQQKGCVKGGKMNDL